MFLVLHYFWRLTTFKQRAAWTSSSISQCTPKTSAGHVFQWLQITYEIICCTLGATIAFLEPHTECPPMHHYERLPRPGGPSHNFTQRYPKLILSAQSPPHTHTTQGGKGDERKREREREYIYIISWESCNKQKNNVKEPRTIEAWSFDWIQSGGWGSDDVNWKLWRLHSMEVAEAKERLKLDRKGKAREGTDRHTKQRDRQMDKQTSRHTNKLTN